MFIPQFLDLRTHIAQPDEQRNHSGNQQKYDKCQALFSGAGAPCDYARYQLPVTSATHESCPFSPLFTGGADFSLRIPFLLELLERYWFFVLGKTGC